MEKMIKEIDENLTLLGIITFFTVITSMLAGILMFVIWLAL